MNYEDFCLDWIREANTLDSFFKGQPGVVRIDFDSEEAAAGKFNYFITERFQNGKHNGQRLSLRLDDDWSTTYTVDDQIFAIARKLEAAGVFVDWKQAQTAVGDVASGNHSEGHIDINISDSVIVNGMDTSPPGVQKRLGLVCDAMRRFVADGGLFLLIVNDMKRHDQGMVWKLIWHAGLRDAVGDHVFLVYYVGPQCGRDPHDDAPASNIAFKLPHNIETDETRQDEVFDDVIEILTARAGYSAEEAASAAAMLVDSNSDSVKRLHMGLSKAIMNRPARRGFVSS